MPCIMRRTSGLPNTSGCPIALSTPALMLPMIWYRSEGCLAHYCSTRTSSLANSMKVRATSSAARASMSIGGLGRVWTYQYYLRTRSGK